MNENHNHEQYGANFHVNQEMIEELIKYESHQTINELINILEKNFKVSVKLERFIEPLERLSLNLGQIM